MTSSDVFQSRILEHIYTGFQKNLNRGFLRKKCVGDLKCYQTAIVRRSPVAIYAASFRTSIPGSDRPDSNEVVPDDNMSSSKRFLVSPQGSCRM